MLCGLGFASLYYGYGAEDHKAYSVLEPRYDPEMAEKVCLSFGRLLSATYDAGIRIRLDII